mmetsp:Transcript_60654/g.113309  ORF Transcript_60654/g.113309 Transcript_60654/m.113309 type:complete len:249 (-) Transcript_60654:244-990(-)
MPQDHPLGRSCRTAGVHQHRDGVRLRRACFHWLCLAHLHNLLQGKHFHGCACQTLLTLLRRAKGVQVDDDLERWHFRRHLEESFHSLAVADQGSHLTFIHRVDHCISPEGRVASCDYQVLHEGSVRADLPVCARVLVHQDLELPCHGVKISFRLGLQAKCSEPSSELLAKPSNFFIRPPLSRTEDLGWKPITLFLLPRQQGANPLALPRGITAEGSGEQLVDSANALFWMWGGEQLASICCLRCLPYI